MDLRPAIASPEMLADLEENARPWIGASMEAHAQALSEVLDVADLQIAGSPIGERLRAQQEPMAPEDEAQWLALIAKFRSKRQRDD